MTVEAHAKVNLTLEVYGKRPDGYHALRSLVVPISLADTLDVELTDDGVFTSDTGYPDDLCLKAVDALRSRVFRLASSPSGVRVRVTKRIPVGGGLGGGSADAAATLRALNELWRLGKTPEELAAVGADVGSDVPALVLVQHYRRTVLMEGRGEKVSLANPALLSRSVSHLNIRTFEHSNDRPLHLLLANPGISVSTPEIFRLCAPRTVPAAGLVNDLQEPACRRHPEIARTLEALAGVGATDVRMSGSGATCFGIAPDAASAARMSEELGRRGLAAWAVRTLDESLV